jgi:N-acetylglucosaminyldiphosphoundecaprenol N-acetyl-beta-D-mannosaminyltransferase
MEEATAKIVHALQRRSSTSPLLIMGPNAQLITLAQKDIHFAEALRASELNVPDGISVVLASKILGSNISKRVPGGELMEHLCREAAQHKLSIFLLGGLPGAATIAAAQLQQRYPDLCIAGTYCPPFKFEHDPVESAHVRELIAEASPDLLFVALGAPRQEIWMHQNCSTLPIGAAMSVGAAFDTLAGFRRRAPLWTQRLGMEWLYRLVQEPRRLWRRYLIGNTHFIFLILKQLLIHGRLPLQEEQVPVNISRELSPGCPPHQTACGS